MGLSCGAQCAKFILFGFNIVFWLSGVALIAAGTFVAVSDDLSLMDQFIESGDSQLKYVAYGLIGIGVFVFIVGFCGCCGAIKESRCLLGMYIALLVIVLILELAIGIFTFVLRKSIQGRITSSMTTVLKENYPNANTTNKEGQSYKKMVDDLQTKGKCCGIDGIIDWKESAWRRQSKFPALSPEYPPSCCPNLEVPEYSKKYDYCVVKNLGYKLGCKEYVKRVIAKNAPIIIGVGCGIAALEIFGLIFAICLCRSIGNADYDA